jgi:predicted Holliday junction resolvase-like endonuclease
METIAQISESITLFTIAGIISLSTICLLQLLQNRKLQKKQIEIDNKILSMSVENQKYKDSARELQLDIVNLQEELGEEREKNRVLLSQKKSSETRLGQISEHIVPFLDACPYDPKNLHFLGNPIDYVCFDFDQGSITFLEVKSGNSKPSKRQKTVKNIIKTGRVFYDEIRINEKGIRIKNYQNTDTMNAEEENQNE